MNTPLFHPKSFNEAQHAAVGSCNGMDMATRYKEETPVFAKAILRHKQSEGKLILDYGCGPGRMAKELLAQDSSIRVIGVDNSPEMRAIALKNVNSDRFSVVSPEELNENVDFVYLVYCLQHVPAIEIRDLLQRIYTFLKDDGKLFYCSSDYRMAITPKGQFFDDTQLGVNLQDELSRFFIKTDDGFTQAELDASPIVKTMVKGSLPHPAIVYKKKAVTRYLFNATLTSEKVETPIENIVKDTKEYKKLILSNPLSPGDVLVMSTALRALHTAYPNEYQTDVRSPAQEIFQNSPYITPLNEDDPDVKKIDMLYPEIHKSGESGKHFTDGHRLFLARTLNKSIPQVTMRPDIFLTQDERLWLNPLALEYGYKGRYWVINAGSKGDYTLKQYYHYQEVVTLLKDKIKFAQIGQKAHNHVPLDNVYDMCGKTNLRQLFRLIYHAEGVISCVSLPMHIAAAFSKPCVVIAGGREGVRWEMYPNHRYLHVTGCCPNAMWDGCWKSKKKECPHQIDDIPLCMRLITPEKIVDAVELYYKGGILKNEKIKSII